MEAVSEKGQDDHHEEPGGNTDYEVYFARYTRARRIVRVRIWRAGR